LQKFKKLAFVALLSILVVGIAFGVLKYTEKITNNVTITGYELQLWRVDTNARVITISWGSLDQGLNKTSDEAFGFTQKLAIKNTGDYALYGAWKLNSTLPNGATLTAQIATSGEGTSYIPWAQNDYYGAISPGGLSAFRIQWTLIIPDGTPRGPMTFDVLLLAGETNNG
jgi:hypothetical protein